MKKKIFLIILLILIGLSLIMYPIISGILASKNQTIAITNYDKTIEEMPDEQLEKMIEEMNKYNESLADSIYNEQSEARSYIDYLKSGDIMGYISVPKVGIYLPIYHGTSKDTLEKGAGHLEKTSLPIGGASTHAVLTGHTGLSRAKMFDDIRDLEVGDVFYIHTLNKVLAYKVDKIKVVKPTDDSDLHIISGQDYVTLLTCIPRVFNTYRLLVRGTRILDEDVVDPSIDNSVELNNNNNTDLNNTIEISQEELIEQNQVIKNIEIIDEYCLIILILPILLILIIILSITSKKKKKGKHIKKS